MYKLILVGSLAVVSLFAQTPPAKEPEFEVASIKPSMPGDRSGRFATMRGAHEFEKLHGEIPYLVCV